MAPSWIISAIAGTIFGSTSAWYLLSTNKPRENEIVLKQSPTVSKSDSLVDAWPIVYGDPEPARARKTYHGFQVEYDRKSRLASWAYEVITKESVAGDAQRSNKFLRDTSEDTMYQVQTKDYTGSGYDRGHLVPAADLKSSEEAITDSFFMTNVCPMNANLNRNYWSYFERFVRNLTKHFDQVHVFTGPLFLPTYDDTTQKWRMNFELLGTKSNEMPLVSVPTHFFKIILGVHTDSVLPSLGCFVIPNEAIEVEKPLTDYQVPIRIVEYFSGHQFFPGLFQTPGKKLVPKNLCDQVQCKVLQNHFAKQNK